LLENEGCSRCEALEEENNLLTKEKDLYKGKKEKFDDEVSKLNKEKRSSEQTI